MHGGVVVVGERLQVVIHGGNHYGHHRQRRHSGISARYRDRSCG
jgi:hypothetical protein